MRAQDIIRDIPRRFIDAKSAAELLQLASEMCCEQKKVLPTSDQGRSVPIHGFVCTGCGTAWNITELLWERTVGFLPQEYRDYFAGEEGKRAMCAALNVGAPGGVRGE